ncbi:MAG TPA: alkaline phosphatase family protein, partial [Verrucomicrobiae bacterium]|nr:alkaline phosphatase family protein [Verrucomicrobiae bacterium]
MVKRSLVRNAPLVAGLVLSALAFGTLPARGDGNLNNVNHIVLVMQENHSFDNYFGVLAFVPNTPYHSAKGGRRRACAATDNTCVDGLSCRPSTVVPGELVCKNRNPSSTGHPVRSFHDPRYCTGPDLDHSWAGSHHEGNFLHPNAMLKSSRNQGFVKVNAQTEQPNQLTDHDTMGYYTDVDLPFYYELAMTFAISDRYFADIIGQTFPNRAYFLAGTSFGHLTTNEIVTMGGYKPITGTIFDRMNAAGVSWTDYYSDFAYSGIFTGVFTGTTANIKPLSMFAGDAGAGTLPDVSFIDPSAFKDQPINGSMYETDEHPPNDIRAGEYLVSQIVGALRSSPNWSDSVLFFTYDEHGGFYDHVMPPPAPQGGMLTPDGIAPGQCADLSNPPASEMPGGGANCSHSSTVDAPAICPSFT